MNSKASRRHALGYGRAARAYERVLDPTLERVTKRIVELAVVVEGDRVLDLATGTGAVARAAFAHGAAVVGLDVAEPMVMLARDVSPPGVTFVVGDAASLPFDAGSFDVVTCGFGLSHMPDALVVLDEVARVLGPAGRFSESSWGTEGNNPAFATILAELRRATGGAVHAFGDILDEDTWADSRRGAGVLSAAGFEVEVVTEPLHGTYADATDALDWTLAWPDYAETFRTLSGPDRQLFKDRAVEAVADTDLDWWFAINYYVANKLDQR